MDKGILNEPLVQKNVALLESYCSEEKNKLGQIFNVFSESISCYKSGNTGAISSKISNLKNNNSTIYYNRQRYIDVLNKAIQIYIDTAQQFVSSAKSMEVKINDN